MMRFLLAMVCLVGCRAAPPAAAPLTDAPVETSTATVETSDCEDLRFEMIPGQWPEPQFVRQPSGALLFGGGWSSISTGRFGSASWEHCETLAVYDPGRAPLPDALRALVVDNQQCRMPDGMVGDRLYDVGWMRKTLPGHTLASAKQEVGWAPTSQFGDSFYFTTLDLWVDGQWKQLGWPSEGFYEGFSATRTVRGHLLLAGGFASTAQGVAQSAIFRHDREQWSYTANLAFARGDHALMAHGRGALAIGGVGADGATVRAIEEFDDQKHRWRVVTLGPPIARPAAARLDERIAVLEVGDAETPSSQLALVDPDGTWRWGVPPLETARFDEDHSLLEIAGGLLLITPTRVERYDPARDRWQTCHVPRQLDLVPVAGRGAGTWGPAAVASDGRVLLTRIDRERYYDFDE